MFFCLFYSYRLNFDWNGGGTGQFGKKEKLNKCKRFFQFSGLIWDIEI